MLDAPVDTIEAERDDSLLFVSADAFTYGGRRRYTLYGDLPLAETRIDPLRATVVGGTYAGLWLALHLNMSKAWWGDRAEFHFKNDWDGVLQIDKAGHAFSGYMMSYGLSEGLMGAGVSWRTATVAGSALGLIYQTYIELEDGFSENWGFSMSDMVANTVGAGYYLAQHYIPALQSFTPKYQYIPAAWIGASRLSTTWIDDYNSSTFWMAIDVHNLLPASARESWPAWLGLALGYGVDIDESRRERRYIVALDYDLTRILPEGGHLWNWFRQTLNYIKLPAPAVEFSPSPKFMLMFPWRM